jgi:hypothetical protein
VTAVNYGGRNVRTLIALVLTVATLSGCATVGGAHALATPWGVGGLYSFKDKAAVAGEPSPRSVDVQVAKALDGIEQQQSSNEDVRVANR